MSKCQVDEIVNHFDTGAPDCPKGLTVTGFTTFSGGVSIGGTLTYEDVTNIDSVGIITAQSGIHVTGGDVGIGTINNSNNERLRVQDDATTSTVCQLSIISGNAERAVLNFGDKDDANIGRVSYHNNTNTLSFFTDNTERLLISGVGTVMLRANQGSTETNIIRFEDTDTSAAANQKFGQLQWYSNDASGAGPCVKGEIYVAAQDTTPDGYMVFATHDGGSSTVATERMRISSDGKIGIGTDNPAMMVHIEGGTPYIRAKQTAAPSNEKTWDFNAGTDGILRFRNINDATDSANNWLEVERNGVQTNSLRLLTGSGSERLRINSSGGVNVGSGVISAASGAGNIVVDEGIYIGTFNGDNQIRSSSAGSGSSNLFIGNAQIQVSSDRRLKENIVDTVVDASEELKKVRVVDFTWNDPSDLSYNNKNARGTWTGVIAQELVDVFPFAVNAPRKEEDLSIDHESEKTWMLNQDQLVPVLIKGFQQALTRIETLEAEVSELRGN